MFKQSAFMKAQYEPRTAVIGIPALSDFFDGKPEWKVRGQTASEIALAINAVTKQESMASIIEAISDNESKISELKQALGVTDDTPDDIVKRLEQLTQCSIEPVIDLPCAVKLAETHPIEFYILTNKIVELTGLGMDVKKPKPSGPTKT